MSSLFGFGKPKLTAQENTTANDAARKYQSRDALVKDVGDLTSLLTQLRLGLKRIVDDGEKDLNAARKDLELKRSKVDSAKGKKETTSESLAALEVEVKNSEQKLREKADAFYSIFGRDKKDYIVRDKGLKADVEKLLSVAKSVKDFYKLIDRANDEATKGARRGWFGDEAEFVTEEAEDEEDEDDDGDY